MLLQVLSASALRSTLSQLGIVCCNKTKKQDGELTGGLQKSGARAVSTLGGLIIIFRTTRAAWKHSCLPLVVRLDLFNQEDPRSTYRSGNRVGKILAATEDRTRHAKNDKAKKSASGKVAVRKSRHEHQTQKLSAKAQLKNNQGGNNEEISSRDDFDLRPVGDSGFPYTRRRVPGQGGQGSETMGDAGRRQRQHPLFQAHPDHRRQCPEVAGGLDLFDRRAARP
jgi:hypothetical protein